MASKTAFNFSLPCAKPILELDKGDADSHSFSSASANGTNGNQLCHVNTKKTVAKAVNSCIPQSVLIGSLLEHLCSFYEPDSNKAKKLFQTICKQLESLEVVSPVTYLEEYASIRSQYKRSFYNLIQTVQLNLDKKRLPIESGNQNQCELKKLISPMSSVTLEKIFSLFVSRYEEEFDEICEIGKGAFGKVFKARSKIDQQEYAVKKIYFNDINLQNGTQQVKKIMREVQSLAALQHRHIVRYHHSWMEHNCYEDTSTESDSNSSLSFSPVQNYSNAEKDDRKEASKSKQDSYIDLDSLKNVGSSDGSWLSFQNSFASNAKSKFWMGDDENDDTSFSKSARPRTANKPLESMQSQSPPNDIILTEGVLRNAGIKRVHSVIFSKNGAQSSKFHLVDAITAQMSRSKSDNNLKDVEAIGGKKFELPFLQPVLSSEISVATVTLFIQMQICDSSLQKWLSERNDQLASKSLSDIDRRQAVDIYKQLLSALSYIHEKEVLHRDLKPRNIFLNGTRPHILLGDFGLSRSSVSRHSSAVLTPVAETPLTFDCFDEHTSGIGTTSYAAPEQLAQENYDFKADMYSAGIILFELTWPLQTGHERSNCIKNLRQEKIPDNYISKWKKIAPVLQSLVSHNPNVRPSAQELLDKNLFHNLPSVNYSQLFDENQKLKEEVVELRALVEKYRLKLIECNVDPKLL